MASQTFSFDPGASLARNLIFSGVMTFAAGTVHGDIAVAVGNQGLPIAFSQFDVSQGWRFNIDVPIQVTALGLMDANLDGFQAEHAIGIFKSDGSSIVSSVLEAGDVHPLVNKFRYVSIQSLDPIILSPGEDYTIGYFSPAWAMLDSFVIWNGTHTMHPAINQVGGSFHHIGDTFVMPDEGGSGQCFGPNFQFTIVPAAHSIGVMLLALAGSRRRT